MAPFQVNADEVTDVVSGVAAKLVQQLPDSLPKMGLNENVVVLQGSHCHLRSHARDSAGEGCYKQRKCGERTVIGI